MAQLRPYRAKEILTLCRHLQWMERKLEDQGVAELMRLAVNEQHGDDTAIVLCRLLFKPRVGNSLRRPARGAHEFIGNTTYSDWPLEPVHVFRGVPFYIVNGWTIGGFPEPSSWYLAYCLRNGVWIQDEYCELGDHELQAIGREFVVSGPWNKRLNKCERRFLMAQVE